MTEHREPLSAIGAAFQKPARSRDGLFLVEGRFAVEALLESPHEVESVLLVEGQHEDLAERIPAGVELVRATRQEAEAVTGYPFHRGVIACARRPTPVVLNPATVGTCVVFCPELADEGNLGTLVRNAAGLGADAVVVDATRGADVYSRKAIRASSGAVFRLPVYLSIDPLREAEHLRAVGFSVIGTALTPDALSLRELPPLEKMAVVFGTEKEGLSPEWLSRCDYRVMIPMKSGLDSLNVGCSSGIILYELLGRK